VSGKTVDVNMQLDGTTYHFVPNTITVKAGDAIRFHNVSGGPHNVGFDATTIPANVQTALAANMPGDHSMGALEGPLLIQPNETYTVSFANIPPGTYAFHCFPHLALGMKGTITVQ
jgi:plastocyanin